MVLSLNWQLAIALFFLLCGTQGAFAKNSTDIRSPESLVLKSGSTRDGKSLLRKIESTFEKASDYIYSTTLTTYKNGRQIKESGKFFFKDPNLVRFEVAKGGKRGGSVVVKQPNGKIKAKSGGILGALTVSLSPNSKLLISANGYNVLRSDFESLLEAMLKKVKPGHTCVATLSPSTFPELGKVHLIEVIGLDNKVVERLVLDPVKLLPKEWILFQHAKILSITKLTQIKLNANISTDMFVLERGGEALANAKSFEMMQLADSSDLSGVPATMSLFLDLKKEVKALRDSAVGLEALDSAAFGVSDSKASAGEQSEDSNMGFQRLLIYATKMELILDKLKSMTPKMKEVDLFSGRKYSIYPRWNTFVNRADRKIDSLMEQIEVDVPDVSGISNAAQSLKKDSADLDSVISDAMRSL